MQTGLLEKLFGSAARIKIIRLFLLNPDTLFISREISRRCKVVPNLVRREISLLNKIGFIKQKKGLVDDLIKLKNGKIKNNKKKVRGWVLNESFVFLSPLKNLVLDSVPVDREKIIRACKKAGKIKLIILSGIFVQSADSRVDILLVGDAIKKSALDRALRNIEAETGKELTYAVFSTKEFAYRVGMYDRFVHDVLDYPHEKILNKMNV